MVLKRIYHLIMFQLYPMISQYFENQVYTVCYGLIKGLKRKGGLGFIPIMKMTEEERFLANLKLKGQTIFDVGAFTGLFTMFFARVVGKNGKVIAFEPNPGLCIKIKENLLLNNFTNAKVMQLALGSAKKREILAFPSKIPGVGSIEKHEKNRILQLKNVKTVEVEVDTVDNLVMSKKIPPPDLVKIDVQGAEFDVLMGMSATIKNYKPKILVEIHSLPYTDWKKHLRKVLKFLMENEYLIYHVESGSAVTLSNASITNPDEHLWCIPLKLT